MRAVFRLFLVVFVVAGISLANGMATTLYSIGPDSAWTYPGGFYSVPVAGAASWLFDLGNGSLGFNGGLAFNPIDNLIYAIANDSSGNSSLISFSALGAGAFTTIGSLGTGFVSGLAYNSADGYLYGISTDPNALSSLNKISLGGAVTPVGQLGYGFYGGLTFNPADGLLYGFSGDSYGVQRWFNAIQPGSATATQLFLLGDGSASFNGGVAFYPQGSLFYVISNDWLGSSTLQTFTLAGAGTLAPVSGIGNGFINVGLVEATPIPEPSLWLPMAACLAVLGVARYRRRQ